MVKIKYIHVRFPEDAYNNFVMKANRMKEVYKNLTGKSKAIPMTTILRIASKKPLWVHDEDLIKLFKRGVNKIC